jgi:acid stress chaperone HdeB
MKSGSRRFIGCLMLAGMLVPSIGQAQMMVEMPLVTCAQYLAMPPEQSSIFAAWMSGWFNQKMGYTYINLEAYAKNVANVRAWCASNPGELVMTGLQRATAPK